MFGWVKSGRREAVIDVRYRPDTPRHRVQDADDALFLEPSPPFSSRAG
jgi:hypothetical protein